MENAVNALRMAAGLLFAILLISLLVFMMDQFRGYAENDARNKTEEAKIKFNKQFEAYDKKQMYGTDLISVMNLAFNESASKKANGYGAPDNETLGFTSNKIGGKPVKIEIRLKSELSTTVTAYGLEVVRDATSAVATSPTAAPTLEKPKFKERKITGTTVDDYDSLSDKTLSDLIKISRLSDNRKKSLNSVLKQFGIDGTLISKLIDKPKSYDLGKKIIINDYSKYKEKNLQKILALQGRPVINLSNPTRAITYDDKGNLHNIWTRITVNTPSYDIKKRVFECKDIEYEDGYLVKMTFNEI